MLSEAQFSVLYPNLAARLAHAEETSAGFLALFSKEKGWRCGKSFISHRSKCYTNPKTGKKLGYKYEINPKTGRRRKVRVGLTYKQYQKARSKAVKKKGQGKRLRSLEQKYIGDIKRLAWSTRKKKQQRLDAKTESLLLSQGKKDFEATILKGAEFGKKYKVDTAINQYEKYKRE